jgi:hypothetical protein
MPVSAKYVREHPEQEYVLDMPGHEFHSRLLDWVQLNPSETVILGGYIETTERRNHFIPCTEDNITVKGNLQHYGPNGEGAADDGELFYVGRDIDHAALMDDVFLDKREAIRHAERYGVKVFRVQVAIFFDTAEEVK